MKQVEYKVEAMHTRKVFEDFLKYTHRAKYPVIRTRLFIFACCFFIATYALRNTGLMARYILVVMGVFLILYAFLINKIGAVRFAGQSKNYKQKIPVIHEFYEEKFKVRNLGPDITYSYSDIREGYENKGYFFLNIKDEAVHVLPKGSFKEGRPEQFREMIEKKSKLEFLPVKTTFRQRYKAEVEAAKQDVERQGK